MKTIPLRYLAQINPPAPEFDSQPEDAEVEFLPLEAVWADARADQTRRILKSASGGYTRYNSGDIVSPKVTPTFQAARSMIAQSAGVGTTELHVLRAREGVDPRWICYALRSSDYLREGVTAFQGVAGLQRVPADFVAAFRVAHRTADEQRRIADFLDDRVARIDQIIVARQRQHDMVDLEAAALLPRALTVRGQAPLSGPDVPTTGWAPTEGWRVAPLGRLLVQLTNGFVGPTRDILTEEGVRYIQGTHIKHGSIDFQRHPYYVREDWARSRPRILLRPKDILLVQTGAIGEVAMVPDDFGEASCHALLIARTNRDVADPTYLTEYLRSSSGQAALLARATGALHPHLEFGIKSAPILLPRLEVQREVAAEVQTLRAQVSGATESITASIALLQEYKQSLITAAVTGEFDVTTASTRIPE